LKEGGIWLQKVKKGDSSCCWPLDFRCIRALHSVGFAFQEWWVVGRWVVGEFGHGHGSMGNNKPLHVTKLHCDDLSKNWVFRAAAHVMDLFPFLFIPWIWCSMLCW
jgi:hypothetical protein